MLPNHHERALIDASRMPWSVACELRVQRSIAVQMQWLWLERTVKQVLARVGQTSGLSERDIVPEPASSKPMVRTIQRVKRTCVRTYVPR